MREKKRRFKVDHVFDLSLFVSDVEIVDDDEIPEGLYQLGERFENEFERDPKILEPIAPGFGVEEDYSPLEFFLDWARLPESKGLVAEVHIPVIGEVRGSERGEFTSSFSHCHLRFIAAKNVEDLLERAHALAAEHEIRDREKIERRRAKK